MWDRVGLTLYLPASSRWRKHSPSLTPPASVRSSSSISKDFIMLPLEVILGIVLNVFSTVFIVLGNKYLWQVLNFKYMVVLSGLHFVATATAVRLFNFCGFFKYKHATVKQVMPLCLGSLGSVAFMNLNLAYNSVGFYQVSKLMCIPAILFLQAQFWGKTVSTNIKLSLVVILCGVGIATVSDFQLNSTGCFWASLAVLSTTLAQIFTSSAQGELQLDAMQLLYHTAPIIGVGMFLLAIFLEDLPALMVHEFDSKTIGFILLTCALSIGVNFSNYLVLGKTSPITYQVVGHFKTCLILTFGFLVFQYPVVYKNLFGIAVALVGMGIYSELKRQESLAVVAVPQSKEIFMTERPYDKLEQGSEEEV